MGRASGRLTQSFFLCKSRCHSLWFSDFYVQNPLFFSSPLLSVRAASYIPQSPISQPCITSPALRTVWKLNQLTREIRQVGGESGGKFMEIFFGKKIVIYIERIWNQKSVLLWLSRNGEEKLNLNGKKIWLISCDKYAALENSMHTPVHVSFFFLCRIQKNQKKIKIWFGPLKIL